MKIDPSVLVQLRGDAETLRRYKATAHADTIDHVLSTLEAAATEHGDAVLNLQEAARESGYSADHLGRKVREGKIPNAGEPFAPKIRRRDLPHKPGYEPAGLRDASGASYPSNAQVERIVGAIVAEGLEAHDGS